MSTYCDKQLRACTEIIIQFRTHQQKGRYKGKWSSLLHGGQSTTNHIIISQKMMNNCWSLPSKFQNVDKFLAHLVIQIALHLAKQNKAAYNLRISQIDKWLGKYNLTIIMINTNTEIGLKLPCLWLIFPDFHAL